MPNNSVAVVGVLYPLPNTFINDYIKSLESQSFKEFDLILFNDGFENAKKLKKNSLNILLENVSGTPSEIRLKLINYIIGSNYEHIIFTDCDDFFSYNRIETSLDLLSSNKIIFNDLDLISETGEILASKYLSSRIRDGQKIIIDDLLDFNMMGLTNTATRKELLRDCMSLLTCEVIAFDWLLWSASLLNNNDAIFTSDTTTKYRIYENNIAGFPKEISSSFLRKGIAVKLLHYKELSKVNSNYKSLYEHFKYIKKMSNNDDWIKEYIIALNKHKEDNSLWWEDIKLPKEVGIL
tara:strand:- start:8585 stop:9466 length:882 start_codon:yes stop_codon:yes gene_type:complete